MLLYLVIIYYNEITMKNIRNTKKVIKIANSMGVVIDKTIANSMNLKKGDLIEFSFKKIKGVTK